MNDKLWRFTIVCDECGSEAHIEWDDVYGCLMVICDSCHNDEEIEVPVG